MRVHYFQRYHQKENVATANTILLLSRFYSYSVSKFYNFISTYFFDETFLPELVITTQEKHSVGVLDATISQEGFKVIIETKINDGFGDDQLLKYLECYGDANNKLLITLAPKLMKQSKLEVFDKKLDDFNKRNLSENKSYKKILHLNTTFGLLADAIADQLNDNDYEMRDIVEDYLGFCKDAKLLPDYDSWKYLKAVPAGATIDFNKENNLYYHPSSRNFGPHDYIGLYYQKSIRLIGVICAIIRAVKVEDNIVYHNDMGELTMQRKDTIIKAMEESLTRGYDISTEEHSYFFVENFYDTDFKKDSSGGLRGSRIFDLTEFFTGDIPSTEEMAVLLSNKTWR